MKRLKAINESRPIKLPPRRRLSLSRARHSQGLPSRRWMPRLLSRPRTVLLTPIRASCTKSTRSVASCGTALWLRSAFAAATPTTSVPTVLALVQASKAISTRDFRSGSCSTVHNQRTVLEEVDDAVGSPPFLSPSSRTPAAITAAGLTGVDTFFGRQCRV